MKPKKEIEAMLLKVQETKNEQVRQAEPMKAFGTLSAEHALAWVLGRVDTTPIEFNEEG